MTTAIIEFAGAGDGEYDREAAELYLEALMDGTVVGPSAETGTLAYGELRGGAPETRFAPIIDPLGHLADGLMELPWNQTQQL
jgi:hypothetical protein